MAVALNVTVAYRTFHCLNGVITAASATTIGLHVAAPTRDTDALSFTPLLGCGFLAFALLCKQAFTQEVGEDNLTRQVLVAAAQVGKSALDFRLQFARDRVGGSNGFKSHLVAVVAELAHDCVSLRSVAPKRFVNDGLSLFGGRHKRKAFGTLRRGLLDWLLLLLGRVTAQLIELASEDGVL